MSEYVDWRCGDDLDPAGRDAPPLEVLAQDLYHLLITNPFSLVRDPDWGFGLESYLNRPLPATLAQETENAITRDDRVSKANATITPTGDPNSYRLDVKVEVDEAFLTLAIAISPTGIRRLT